MSYRSIHLCGKYWIIDETDIYFLQCILYNKNINILWYGINTCLSLTKSRALGVLNGELKTITNKKEMGRIAILFLKCKINK